MISGLAPGLAAFRLTLHVLAAAVWVGGQLTVAGLLPTVRGLGETAPSAVARGFARLAWPAYAVLLATGVWNVFATHPHQQSTAWNAVLSVKIAVVLLAGVAAWVHTRVASRVGLAVWGAVSGLTSITALTLGVLLAG
jgi:putative copper export protein